MGTPATVDGSEIRRSAVEVGSLQSFILFFTRFYTSLVVRDFFHQQYGSWEPPAKMMHPMMRIVAMVLSFLCLQQKSYGGVVAGRKLSNDSQIESMGLRFYIALWEPSQTSPNTSHNYIEIHPQVEDG